MPKDTTKNRYFQVGVAWNSWTLEQLEADAQLHQMEDQTAKLMVLRLTEYYKLVENGVIIPGVTAMMQAPMQAATVPGSNGHVATTSRKRGSSAVTPPAPEQEPGADAVTQSHDADQNADAAIDYFTMDEEE